MIHTVKTEHLRRSEHYHISDKRYIVGDTLFFQETKDGVCTGGCFSLVVKSIENIENGYKYKLK